MYGYAWFLLTSGCQDPDGNVLTPVHVFIKYGGTMNSPNGETKRDNARFKVPWVDANQSNLPYGWQWVQTGDPTTAIRRGTGIS